jgi:hypothetical protein
MTDDVRERAAIQKAINKLPNSISNDQLIDLIATRERAAAAAQDQKWVEGLKVAYPPFVRVLELVGWGDPLAACLAVVGGAERAAAARALRGAADEFAQQELVAPADCFDWPASLRQRADELERGD